jgi:HK97 gp10 family phage protein
MPVKVTITIDGLSEATQYFSNSFARDIRDAVKETLSSVTQDIYDTAKSEVPIDTGLLESSITMSAGEDTAQVKADTDYASYVDEGTSKMDAQPYLAEQAQQKLSQLPSKLEQEIARRIMR